MTISPEARAGPPPDLATETVSTIKAVAAYRANLKGLQTEQEMMASLRTLTSQGAK